VASPFSSPIHEKRSSDGSRASRTSQSRIPRQPGRGLATNWNRVPTGVQRLSSTIVMKRVVDDRPYPVTQPR
jgi:hypothetical protein